MAGLRFTAGSPEVAIGASATKTILMVLTPTNQRAKVIEWGVYFDGVSAVAEPIIVELARATSAGTMNATGSVKVDTYPETVQSTVTASATVEPTITDIIERKEVHPQSGYEKAYGLGDEVWVGGAGRIVIRITSNGAAVNAVPYLKMEE